LLHPFFFKKKKEKFRAEFVVIKDGTLTPLLGNKAVQAMSLLTINYENIKAVRQGAPGFTTVTKLDTHGVGVDTGFIISIFVNLSSKAKIFSVVDAKNGFWHVELDDESSYLTTFNTPFGRYRWLRMPFGISSAPEEYQRRQDQTMASGANDSVQTEY
jgi:hypothetical protein